MGGEGWSQTRLSYRPPAHQGNYYEAYYLVWYTMTCVCVTVCLFVLLCAYVMFSLLAISCSLMVTYLLYAAENCWYNIVCLTLL